MFLRAFHLSADVEQTWTLILVYAESYHFWYKKTLSLNYDPAINLNVLDILIVKSKDEKYFSDLR